MWSPLFTSTMPIVMAIFIAAWLQNKHFDVLNGRMNGLDGRIQALERRIENLEKQIQDMRTEIMSILRDMDRRITRLEERSSPIARS